MHRETIEIVNTAKPQILFEEMDCHVAKATRSFGFDTKPLYPSKLRTNVTQSIYLLRISPGIATRKMRSQIRSLSYEGLLNEYLN